MSEAVTFNVTFRDKEHFYRVVKWMEQNVGHGKGKWTIEGRVLKFLKKGNSVTRLVKVFDPVFESETALYLSLL